MKNKERNSLSKLMPPRSAACPLSRQDGLVCVAWRWLVMTVMALLFLATVGARAADTVVQEFYLPMPESQIYAAFNKQAAYDPPNVNMMSIFSIVVTTPGTVIVYDQWEDGYETDVNAPTDGSTKVWGDGNNANGICPGFASDPSGLPAGTVITLQNEVPGLVRGNAIFYDAGDWVGATRAITITRACYENCCRLSAQACAVEVISTLDHGRDYVAPVGVDILANGMFTYVDLLVMADHDNTTVVVDSDCSGTTLVTNTINRGAHGAFMMDNICKGATVKADKPVQVHMITGNAFTGQFETRSFTLRPAEQWGGKYIIPVGTIDLNYPGIAYVFNTNATALSVGFTTRTSSGTFSVPGANGLFPFELPKDSATLLTSDDGSPFFVVCFMNTDLLGDAGADMEWGFTPMPFEGLTTELVCGWGPGADTSHPASDGNHNGNPVWITAVSDTTLFIDFDGNGLNVTNIAVSALQVVVISDSLDNDQTGLRVYTQDGTFIAGVWGQDPLEADPGPPYFDIGYALPPFPIAVRSKRVAVVVDSSPTNVLNKGDILEYTLRIDNKGLLPLVDVPVVDNLPAQQLEYVEGTTFILIDESLLTIPDDVPNETNSDFDTPFPLDGVAGYTINNVIHRGHSVLIRYQCKIIGTGSIRNGFATATNIVESAVLASIGSASVVEGDSGERDLVFTVTLDSVSERDVSVDFATSDGTAWVTDDDYVATNGVLVILAGQTNGTIIVRVIGDEYVELDETLLLTLSNPVACEIGIGQMQGTIINDDEIVFYNDFLNLIYKVGWVYNPRRDSWYGTLTLSNDLESTTSFEVPVWYEFKKTATHYLRFPTGNVPFAPSGWFYLDLSADFAAKLPLVGNGDAFLDPGESVTLSAIIEVWGRGSMTGYADWVEVTWLPSGDGPSPFNVDDDETPRGTGGNEPAIPNSPDLDDARLDSDGDEIPDKWEDRYPKILNKIDRTDAAIDSDSDGVSNFAEYIANTNPEDKASIFVIKIEPTIDGGMNISWQGSSDRVYAVLCSTNWLTCPFTVIAKDIVGNSPWTVYTDTNATSLEGAFYQVKVDLK